MPEWLSVAERHSDLATESGGDIHEGVEREAGDAAAEQVADAWLGDVATLGAFSLSPPALLYEVCDLLYECGAQAHLLRWGERGKATATAGPSTTPSRRSGLAQDDNSLGRICGIATPVIGNTSRLNFSELPCNACHRTV